MQDIYTDLINCIPKENVYKDEPMKKHTTFHAGGPADFLVLPETEEQLSACIRICRENRAFPTKARRHPAPAQIIPCSPAFPQNI